MMHVSMNDSGSGGHAIYGIQPDLEEILFGSPRKTLLVND